jgi:hypothetical protein
MGILNLEEVDQKWLLINRGSRALRSEQDLWALPLSIRGKFKKNAMEPAQQRGDDKSITVWGFHMAGGFPSCADGPPPTAPPLRVGSNLRKKFDYIKQRTDQMKENPIGTVPVANIYGTTVDDSFKIIQFLKKTLKISDPELTPEQKAPGYIMITKMLTCSFSVVLLHMMFLTEEGHRLFWKDTSTVHGCGVPPPVRPLVKAMIFRDQADK